MKSIKLDHDVLEKIIKGQVNRLFRINDPEKYSLDDDIELINEENKVVGVAKVVSVSEKYTKDVDEVELNNYKGLKNDIGYKKLTGLERVQFISFDFVPYETPISNVNSKQIHRVIKLFADGGSRGNPGPSASGYVLMNLDDEVIASRGVFLGITTNNQAEYKSLKMGLEHAKQIGAEEVFIYMDSLLVINQMKGLFKVRNRDLWPVHESIVELTKSFKKVTFTHVPREFNRLADKEVNKALDANAIS